MDLCSISHDHMTEGKTIVNVSDGLGSRTYCALQLLYLQTVAVSHTDPGKAIMVIVVSQCVRNTLLTVHL